MTNFIPKINALLNKIHSSFSLLIFYVIKKPLYQLSYNTHGNMFKCKGKIKNSSIIIQGRNNVCIIEKGVTINNTQIKITGNNHKLIIHKDVTFVEGGRIRMEDKNNLIEINEKSILINCFLTTNDPSTKIIIGKNCLLSAGIIIRSSDGHSIINSNNKRINQGQDTIIGDHVWIGYGVTVLKGVHIGNNSIIGTQSLVTSQQIPEGSVAVGIPAKIVKSNVNWDIRRI